MYLPCWPPNLRKLTSSSYTFAIFMNCFPWARPLGVHPVEYSQPSDVFMVNGKSFTRNCFLLIISHDFPFLNFRAMLTTKKAASVSSRQLEGRLWTFNFPSFKSASFRCILYFPKIQSISSTFPPPHWRMCCYSFSAPPRTKTTKCTQQVEYVRPEWKFCAGNTTGGGVCCSWRPWDSGLSRIWVTTWTDEWIGVSWNRNDDTRERTENWLPPGWNIKQSVLDVQGLCGVNRIQVSWWTEEEWRVEESSWLYRGEW